MLQTVGLLWDNQGPLVQEGTGLAEMTDRTNHTHTEAFELNVFWSSKARIFILEELVLPFQKM